MIKAIKVRFFLLVMVIILATSTVIGGHYGGKVNNQHTSSQQIASAGVEQSIGEAISVIESNYTNNLERTTLAKASIQGMLHSLDPHSNYFDKNEYLEFKQDYHSVLHGIGANIQHRNNRVYVISTVKDGSAAKAGLRYGDAIIRVDGSPTTGLNAQQVSERLRGDLGAKVEIEVERAGLSKPLSFKIERKIIQSTSTRVAYMIRPGIGYIELSIFSKTTWLDMMDTIEKLQKQGMQSLILDLRNNPGGILDQAVELAGMFLYRKQVVVSVRGRDEASVKKYESSNPFPEEMPLIVLINKASASASEIVAGAIQDHDRGLIVGNNSFGKGLVQRPIDLPSGGGLALTTAKYYTPSGRLIQRDYSDSSLYEYFTKRSKQKQEAYRTDEGRSVYSGGGIKPDIEVELMRMSPLRLRVLNATFEFARQLTSGQIEGLPHFKIRRAVRGHKLSNNEFVIDDKVITAFRTFIMDKDEYRISDQQFERELNYIRRCIRGEVVTAAYGQEVGLQVFLNEDEQVLKAIEELPRARAMAKKARENRPYPF
ncbi:MAG: S41 family peptidase [Acidobacteriota bacterium]